MTAPGKGAAVGAARNWLIGCGIGCGVVILLGAILIGGGAWWIKGMVNRFDDATERTDTLVERYGRAEDWTPPARGAIAPERMAVFLAVRDSTAAMRARLDETFSSFEDLERADREGGKPRFGEVLRAIRGGLGIAPLMGEFLAARAGALESAGMGLGEYTYIYALGYFGYLGKNPDSGPGNVRFESDEPDRDVRRRAHRLLLSMLHNQRTLCDSLGVAASWRDSLTAEIAAMEDDRRRVPWQDGLPPAIAESFAPHRERLEAAWSDAGNIFELGRLRRGSRRMEFDFGE